MLQSSLGGFRLWSEGGSLPSSFFCKDGRPVAEKLGTVNCPIHCFVYSSEFLGGSVLSVRVKKPGVISSSSSKSSRAPRYLASKSDNPAGSPLDLDTPLLPEDLTISRGGKDIGVPSLSLNMLSMPTSSTASMMPRLWRFSSIFLLNLDDLCSALCWPYIADFIEEKKLYTTPALSLSSGEPGRLSSGVWSGVPVGEICLEAFGDVNTLSVRLGLRLKPNTKCINISK